MAEPDIGRVKRNIQRMISLNAPEADIDAYVASEGVTLEQLRGASPVPAKQEMVGFGTRADREQDMPETPDVARERRIAQRMARDRENFGADDVFLQDYTFGLRDEAKGVGAGVAGLLHGRGFSEGYDEAQEADKRLRDEYAQQNPNTATAASIGGMVTGGVGKAISAPTTFGGALGIGSFRPLQSVARPSMATRTTGQMIGEGAIVGGSQGAIHGFAEGDETASGRLGGALIEGGVGGLIGGAVPTLLAAGQRAAQPLVNTYRGFRNADPEAARRVQEVLARDRAAGAGMTDAEYAAAQAAGRPVALMDRGGEGTRALVRSSADGSTEARQAMLDVADPRYATQNQRVVDNLGELSTLHGNPEAHMEAAGEAARRANRSAYDEAYSLGSGDVWSPRLERLLQAPAVERAMQTAVRKYRDHAITEGFGALNSRVTLDEAGNLLFRNEGGLTVRPDLQLWDLAKRELDNMASQAQRSGNRLDERTFTRLAQELRNTLDGMGDMGAAYRRAREGAAAIFGAENAYQAGMSFLNAKGISSREAVRGISRMNPEERNLFREGYIQALRDKIHALGDNRDAVLALMNSPTARDIGRIALGRQGYDRLMADIAVERAMNATRRELSGNSRTARYMQEAALATAAGTGVGVAGGDQVDMSIAGVLAAGTRFGKRQADERMARSIGRLLASNDPANVERLARMAQSSPRVLHILQSIGAVRPGLVAAGSVGATQSAASQ